MVHSSHRNRSLFAEAEIPKLTGFRNPSLCGFLAAAGLALLAAGGWAGDESAADGARAPVRGDFQVFEGVTYVDVEWNDGDSFRVSFPDGKEHNLRLYGVDCLENKQTTDIDARRVREQRRYFGIANRPVDESVKVALEFGKRATERTRELLARSFTVHTAFADGRGDPRFPRFYAFVTTAAGRDLSAQLVSEGLARAFGVARSTPQGASQDEFRQMLFDLETTALARGRGIWAETDWDSLPQQRREQRAEIEEMAVERRAARPDVTELRINPNTAARREIEELPGIGEALALRIIEGRNDGPYRNPEDLLRVTGIGGATLDRIRPGLVFD